MSPVPDFRDWQSQASSFEAMAYTYGGEMGVKAGQYGEFHGDLYHHTRFFQSDAGCSLSREDYFLPEEEKPNGANAGIW